MIDIPTPSGQHQAPPAGPGQAGAPPGPRGVGGWLLLLCVMLTIVGPLIVLGLLLLYCQGRPASLGLAAVVLLQAGSTAYGMYAGLGLWALRPGALQRAKKALLYGLAANVVTAVVQLAAGPAAGSASGLLNSVMLQLLPDLVFFTACFAYLNKSARVQATYPG